MGVATSSAVLVLCTSLAQVWGVSQAPSPPRDASATAKGTAALRGKVVTADTGRPIRRVQISLSSSDGGEPRTVSSNAQGIFEITDLPAGRYTVTAARSGYLRLQYGQRRPGEPGRPVELRDGQKFTNLDFALPRASAIIGRVTDEVGDPLPNASIFPMQWRYFRGEKRLVPTGGGGPFNRTDDTGQYRITGMDPGDYYVMAVSRESWTDEKDAKERIGFLPTFSGGTASPTEAARVRVVLGQDATVPDFPMVPGRVGTISGTALSSSGAPLVGESISLSQEFQGPGASSSFGAPGTKVATDGTFSIRNVVPGTYKMTLRVAGDSERPMEGATTTFVFTGDDLSGIQLLTTPGGTLRGRVITDTGEALPRDHKMTVSARPLDTARTFSAFSQDNGRVRDDLSFEVTGVFGVVKASVAPVPPGWYVRSVQYEGKDLLDTTVDVTGGQRLDGVTVLLTRTLPVFRGTLLDDKGHPSEGSVVLFPEDTALWAEESRLIRRVRPDSTGAFEFRNLIPGKYLAAAVEYVRDGDFQDPSFLEGLREHASPVRIDEREATAPLALTLRARQP